MRSKCIFNTMNYKENKEKKRKKRGHQKTVI
jgi:hypothetical protein